MGELIRLDTAYHDTFLAAMAEFAAEGRTGEPTMVGDDLATWTGRWETPAGFAEYVGTLNDDALRVRKEGWVLCTNLWWVEDGEYVGRLAIRHELNDWLLEVGGHIGYDVRRSRRREGHATALLAAALPIAVDLGIERALITCDTDNVGSRRVIEKNGGVLEDERQGKLRYWVDLTER
ncbi:GNAT family N-acetyltransferase [Nocardioides marmorisolisilvae]|uniref:GNAT family N-acetyltransferase n=1 Tax=Nocardioides marmorisolisilvae TaxID=1542737 RepID=A0A3N0DT80_9ACTN|nr:GNAT family N-acetyltransferase [Nocardioides marmorisolisilvae]RNL78857.1 GNAT family N-acetyltransferase [Nocardioides marmorisolisilvae]